MQQNKVNKFQILQSRLQASQFVFSLDARTLLPIEVAAPTIGKSTSTFRSDLIRRPQSLPKITRRNGRVFVLAGDLIDWLTGGRPTDNSSSTQIPSVITEPPVKKKLGRPTKAQQLAKKQAAEAAESAGGCL